MWSEKEKGCMKMKVGFIGLGIMGRPMAKNLLNAGVELLVSDLNIRIDNEIFRMIILLPQNKSATKK